MALLLVGLALALVAALLVALGRARWRPDRASAAPGASPVPWASEWPTPRGMVALDRAVRTTPEERQRRVVRRLVPLVALMIATHWFGHPGTRNAGAEFTPLDFSIHGRDIGVLFVVGIVAWMGWSLGRHRVRPEVLRKIRWALAAQAGLCVLGAVLARFQIGGNLWIREVLFVALWVTIGAEGYYLAGEDPRALRRRRKPSTAQP